MKCCGPQYDLDPITRRKRTSRLSIGPYRRHELLTGWIVYPVEGYTGYGDGVGTDLTAFITDGMHADWEANRDELMEFWRSAHPDNFADNFPNRYLPLPIRRLILRFARHFARGIDAPPA